MDIISAGSRPTARGSLSYFSGDVWIEPVADGSIPNAAKAAIVSFAPAARTAWHTHPLGQTLYVLSGIGYAQVWGGPVRQFRAGDTLWFPPGEKHWHGAAVGHAMIHLAIQEAKDGVTVEWLELVADGDYAEAAKQQA